MATATALLLVLCLTQVEAAPPSPAPTPRIAQPIPTPQALASFEALPGPVLLAAGLGLGMPFGTAPGSVSMSQLARPQLRLPLQVGLRITPEVLVGAYVDIGFGKAGPVALDACHAAGGTGCGATSIHVGVLGRYAFTPGDHGTFWLTAGAGWESTGVTYGGGAPATSPTRGPRPGSAAATTSVTTARSATASSSTGRPASTTTAGGPTEAAPSPTSRCTSGCRPASGSCCCLELPEAPPPAIPCCGPTLRQDETAGSLRECAD